MIKSYLKTPPLVIWQGIEYLGLTGTPRVQWYIFLFTVNCSSTPSVPKRFNSFQDNKEQCFQIRFFHISLFMCCSFYVFFRALATNKRVFYSALVCVAPSSGSVSALFHPGIVPIRPSVKHCHKNTCVSVLWTIRLCIKVCLFSFQHQSYLRKIFLGGAYTNGTVRGLIHGILLVCLLKFETLRSLHESREESNFLQAWLQPVAARRKLATNYVLSVPFGSKYKAGTPFVECGAFHPGQCWIICEQL